MLRTFTDPAGDEWQVFDVIPRSNERRDSERRSSAAPEAAVDAERRERDRRFTVGGRTSIVGVRQGWLAFERGSDRRRLSPIPPDWQSANDAQLVAYRNSARPVKRAASVQGAEAQQGKR